VSASRAGYVAELHAEAIGRAAVALGAGRATLDDRIDHGVGIHIVAPPGTRVAADEPVVLVRHRGGRGLQEAMRLLTGAIRIADAPAPVPPLVVEQVRGGQ
jgi:thymidine phosphorylase